MRAAGVVVVTGAVMTSPASGQSALDDGRPWLDVDRTSLGGLPPLVHAAAAVALNDISTAVPLLQSVIQAETDSDSTSQAYELLSRIYLRSGQYRRLIDNLDAWAKRFPGSPEVREEQADVEFLRGLPDQVNGPRRASHLTHDVGDGFSIDISINGEPARYLLDTGAWISVMTEPEAARLGLGQGRRSGTIGDASGAGVQVRTVVVPELTIGSMQFEDVSFVVTPGEEPGGILGIPVQLALGSIQWSSDGTWEVGGAATPSGQQPNLVFFENKLLLVSEVLSQRVFGTLDTGAVTTDLNANFAEEFAELTRGGTRQTNEITGLGGTTEFDAVRLPEVRLVIAQSAVALRPAIVTLQSLVALGGECCIGNIGLDLLEQTGRLSIDFSSMTLRLD